MILVTGATGRVGGEVVRQLLATGKSVRALVRDAAAATAKLPVGVEIAQGDFEHPETLEAAMQGVDKVYLLVPGTPELPRQERAAIEAAQRAGVNHVVKHSVIGARDPAIALAKLHRASEAQLEFSGLAWTFVRPGSFMTNALGWAMSIKAQGGVFQPLGDGRVAMVDPRDIAAVAVTALTEPGHEGKAYEVTGPEALSMTEHVKLLSDAIGKPIRYVDVPETAAREMMLDRLRMPRPVVEALLEVLAQIKAGKAARVSEDVERVTGRPPRRFEAWAAENAAAFR
jgi:uncharacterized protein YbjT (DUF2867 family)